MADTVQIIVPAEGLLSLGARASAGTVVTKFAPQIRSLYIHTQAYKWF